MDYTDIIDGHLSNFVKDCLNLFDENNKGISYFPSDFEVFNFGGNKFYEYKHKEKIMETYFRDEMIIATLVDLFGFYKIKFLQGTKIVDYKIIPSDDSLLKFDNTHDFVFVITIFLNALS